MSYEQNSLYQFNVLFILSVKASLSAFTQINNLQFTYDNGRSIDLVHCSA